MRLIKRVDAYPVQEKDELTNFHPQFTVDTKRIGR